jgi:hypothetical protein
VIVDIVIALVEGEAVAGIDTVGMIDGRSTSDEWSTDPYGNCFAPTIDDVDAAIDDVNDVDRVINDVVDTVGAKQLPK